MKKTLLLLFSIAFSLSALGQTAVSPIEKALTDSLCDCIGKIDVDKITSKQEATNAFTACFGKRTDLFMKLADEKHLDPTDKVAMRDLGIEIGKNLFYQNCSAFLKLSVKMAENEKVSTEEVSKYLEGSFKRIDLKGFNYVVLNDDNGLEISFLWLKQFPGSEKFMADITIYKGKKLRIKYEEIEVYLPLAKGYYKVKEITGIDFL